MFKKIYIPIVAVITIILIALGVFLLREDFSSFIRWWFVILGLGFIFMPLSNLLFSYFDDKGYLFSKIIGIAITGYLMWFLSSLRILKFNELSCIIVAVVALLINLSLLLIKQRKARKENTTHNKKWFTLGIFEKEKVKIILMEELLFLAIFILFTYVRGFKPEAFGTEKFMDYGFMTTMMRSDYMPPQDFWFSGSSMNYYYVGQYMATFLTRLSFVKTALGYNLMLMMTGAFAFVLPFSLVYNLFLRFSKNYREKKGILPVVSGLVAGTAVTLAGNMHYPIYRWVVPALHKFLQTGKYIKDYWFPDATRFIGYNPDTNDKTIHEFPAYSFVLGDLHAHVINILFVLTVLGVLLGWMLYRMEKKEEQISPLKELFHPSILMIGFFIGLFHTTNFWDFPIYYIVSGAVILFSNLVVYNFKGKAYWLTALQGIFVLVMGEIISLPFTISFNQISSELFWTVANTPLYQLLILWGLPIATVLIFLAILITDYSKKKKTRKKISKQQKQQKQQKQPAAIILFMQKLHGSDLFIITIGLCAIGLIILPELFYIKDIYSGDYKRANTMFKLTYQAYIMFGICMGYIFIRLLRFGRTKLQKSIALIGLLLLTLTTFYTGNAVKAWYGNVFDREGYQGINAAAFMEQELPDDYAATNWLNENVSGTPVVLEANGDSYTQYQRVSVITGLPTVLGWYTHERLWRSEPDITDAMVTDILDQRAADIEAIYTSEDTEMVKSLIKEYGISYIYVGWLEEKKYDEVNHELLKNLGTVVYHIPATENKYYETYIIKVK